MRFRSKWLYALIATGIIGTLICQNAISEEDPFHGLKVGIASYTFRKFPLDKTIKMTKDLGLKYITLKSNHLDLKSTPEECKAVAKQIKDSGLILMGGGTIGIRNDEAEVRKIFEYARNAGMPVITCSPTKESLPIVDKMVKEFDIKVAIHNHGPRDTYPSPLDAYNEALKYDERIGVCADIGHSTRNGDDVPEVLRKVKDRLYDVHLKDVTEKDAMGRTIIIGQGVIDITEVIKTLFIIKYKYHVAFEYEPSSHDPFPFVKRSVEALKTIMKRFKIKKKSTV